MKYFYLFFAIICCSLSHTESFGQTITRGPYLQLGTPNSMVLRWRTSVTTNSKVWYGNSPTNLTNQITISNSTTEHEVLVSGLTPSTTYYYAVGNNAGQLAGADNNHYFKTSPTVGSTPTIRTWVLGDAGKANNNQRNVRDGFYNFIGSTPLDIILQLGDNAYEDGTDAEYQVAWFENMYEDKLINTVVWPCPGNHDLGATADSPTQTGPYYDIYTMPTNGEAGGVPSGTEAYYSFDYGNLHVISLDSDDTSLEPSSPMLSWVQSDLNATNQDWIVVIFHHPPYAGDTRLDAGAKEEKLRTNFLPVLEAGGVDLVLFGHHHVYERSFLINGHYGLSTTFDPSTMALDQGDGKIDGDGAYQKTIGGTGSGTGTIYAISGNAGAAGTPDPPYHPVMEYHYPGSISSSYFTVSGLTLNFNLIDEFGNVADYFTIQKTVVTGNPPIVDIVEPTDGRFYPSPQTITIEASASDPGGQVTQVEFFVDNVSVGIDNTPNGQGLYTMDWTIPANGEYDLKAKVTDNDNNVITSLQESIQVGPITVCVKVVGKKNDVEERSPGNVNVTNKDLELVNDGSNGDQLVGLRFENLGIPQGAAILSADLQFTVGGTSNLDPSNINISAEDSDNALIFGSDLFNVSNRPLTSASVPWSPPNWNTLGQSGPDQQSPDISPVIQEVVNRAGFSTSSSIAIIVHGGGRREAASFDDDPNDAAELCITYTPYCVGGDNDGDGICAAQDCDDNNPLVHELDCNGVCGGGAIDNDGDGSCSDVDCNDNDPLVYPGATEICDGIDNNCDGNIDEGFNQSTYYADTDGDGYGDPAAPIQACSQGPGLVLDNTDCDDTNATIYPGAPEICDGLDNDCNGNIDEAIEICDGIDNDCDGFIDEGVCLGGTLEISITSGDDDVEERTSSGTVKFTSADLELILDGTKDQVVGLRFNGIVLPTGANILDAYIQFMADEVSTVATSLTIWGEDIDDAPPFSSITNNVTDRTTTSASVNWNNVPAWNTVGAAGPSERTPDLSSILQEIVNRAGWLAGNSMVFIIDGTGTRTAEAYDGKPSGAAKLVIEYENATCPPGQFTVSTSGSDISCGGTNDGTATATPAGGTGPFTYAWTGPNGFTASTASISNLATGTYDIEVIDNEGCVANNSFVISNPNNTYYADTDGDGYGDPNGATTQDCSPPNGFVADNTDCNDGNAAVNPGATEICDGIDNNCDGNIDEGGGITFYADTDGDGYGDPNGATTQGCNPPSGFVADNTDCNDGNAAVNPGATEICDGIDNNCDGNIDEGGGNTFYADTDGDGYGDPNNTTLACTAPSGYVNDNTDCDDSNPAINPGATEVCDGIDNNCDGNIDDVTDVTFYADTDGDGYGDPANTTIACSPPAGYVLNDTDCNDNDPAIHPGAPEICDGDDNNCDGNIDEGVLNTYYADTDGDGYGDPNSTTQACAAKPGFVSDNTDCNDNDANIHPGASEVCDGIDNNCDGNIDEGVQNTYYADTDGDGYGDAANTTQACSLPAGFVTNNTDCNDNDANIHPGASEVCDGIDNNCDGNTDEGLTGCNTEPIVSCSRINSSSDDAEERLSGNLSITSSDLELINDSGQGDQTIGMRFVNLNIPPGAAITNAEIQFAADESKNIDPCNLTIYGQATANPPTFVNNLNNITSRPKTSASVLWTPASWTTVGDAGPAQLTANIASVIQEIVNQPGYTESSAIVIIIEGQGKRVAESFNGNAALAPELCVTYDPNCTDNDGDGACASIDCNDNNSAIYPGAPEICDGIDNNCDGNIDEVGPNTYYADTDGDGYGDAANTTQGCSPPTGYVTNSTDCNDNDANIHPGATEICDSFDNNCDGNINEGLTGCNPNPTLTCARISNSTDDAEERSSGNLSITSSDLELVNDGSRGDQVIGMRFVNLNIPPGATISSASIQFTADQTDDIDPCNLTIYGEASDDAAAFVNNLNNITNRPATNAFVSWSPAAWLSNGDAGPAQQTADIASIIQEIVDRPGYTSSSAIVVIIQGTGKRTAESYNGSAAQAPELCVNYDLVSQNQRVQLTPQILDTYTYHETLERNVDTGFKVTVNPNPFQDELWITIHNAKSEAKKSIFSIMDIYGRSLYLQKAVPLNERVSVRLADRLPKGVYLVRVQVDEYLKTIKVVKH